MPRQTSNFRPQGTRSFSSNLRSLWPSCVMVVAFSTVSFGQNAAKKSARKGSIPKPVLVRILRAEDERRWDADLRSLMADSNPSVRRRAALAAGRIGAEDAISALATLLNDKDAEVQAMAAFAIGEIESDAGANVLLSVVRNKVGQSEARARAVEALGKIAAALPKGQVARARELGATILEALKFESGRRSAADRLTVLLGLTAALRAKPTNAGPVIAGFLSYSDSRIRADAANALARLRAKEGNDQLRKILTTDPDPIVRANAARVLGATEDKLAFAGLADLALQDVDSRVRVSAIRALASLKDARAADLLLQRGTTLALQDLRPLPTEVNELLEIATAMGRLLQPEDDRAALGWLRKLREGFNGSAPEVEIAFARISPEAYLAEFGTEATARRKVQETILLNWRAASSIAEALGEIAALPDTVKNKRDLATAAEALLRAMLDYRNSGINIHTLVAVHSEYAVPDVLRALAIFKPKDLPEILRGQISESDVIVRATAAELLGEVPSDEVNSRALAEALPRAMKDELNEAALAILDSLAKQKSAAAIDAIKTALDSADYLLRRRAVSLLKKAGAGDFSARIGTVQTRNMTADYERALSFAGKSLRARVTTTKGSFTIQLLPDEAALNVDNFVQLAKRGYFNGISFHRVVPNFVIQGGDPRGDGNGNPGYQIRCEINEVSFERAAVGMALSGKDTGGSQWFVTHSPQPHLDGGYTVFGKVVDGTEVVDRIVRGDTIRSIVVSSK